MEYLIHVMILVGIYFILSISLNLLIGYTGILSIVHAAFFGTGAYISALIALNFKVPYLLNIFLSVLGTILLGAFIGFSTLRMNDNYFVIATFSFQIVIFSLFKNLLSITGGPMGITGIPEPIIFGNIISSPREFLILVIIFCVIVFFISWKIVKSPFGRVLNAIRENEILTESLGKNVFSFKFKIFIISAGLASISGFLYAAYITCIYPMSFTVIESIFIISIVIIGGTGNLWGSLLGSIILISLPEFLRFIGVPNSINSNIRQIIYGALLIIILIYRPRGLIGISIFNSKSKEK